MASLPTKKQEIDRALLVLDELLTGEVDEWLEFVRNNLNVSKSAQMPIGELEPYERSKDWDGNWQENFRHMGCKAVGGYHILIPATESNRWTQAWNKSILEANETETT